MTKLYAVYSSNYRLELIELLHTGVSRDLAETYMEKYFVGSGKKNDYILVDAGSLSVLGGRFSAETIRKVDEMIITRRSKAS